MKNLITFTTTLFFLLVIGFQEMSAQTSNVVIVELTIQNDGNNTGSNSMPKTPIDPPDVYLSNHTLYFSGAHADYVLTLLDDQNNTVYQTTVYGTDTEVILPSTLSGTFELRLATDIYVFVGEITL